VRRLILFLALIAGLGHGPAALAAACTSAATGNWDAAGTWAAPCNVPGGPVAGDTVTILTGHTVTVAVNAAAASIVLNAPAAANGITINAGILLGVSGAITMNAPTAAVVQTIDVGAGTLQATSIAIPGSATGGRNCIVTVSTGTITTTGSITFSGTPAQAQFASAGASTVNVGGNFGSGGTLTTGGTGAINFNGGAAQTIGTYATYNDIRINNTAGGVTLTGATTFGGTLQVQAGTLTVGAFALTVTGTTTVSNGATLALTSNTGAKTFTGAVTVDNGGLVTLAASSPTFSSTVAIAGTMRCTVNTGTKTFAGAVIVQNLGVLDIQACTANFNSTPTAVTVQSGGTLQLTTSTAGTKTFIGLVTIDPGGTWNNTINEGVNFRGGLTVNGSFTAGTGVYLFNTNAQNIGGSTALSIPNITVTGVTLTNQGDLTVTSALGGTGGLTNAASSQLHINFAGVVGITTLMATACGATPNLVEYAFAGAQTLEATTYCNLQLLNGGTKSATGNIAVNGTLTVSGATTVLTPSAGVIVSGTGTLTGTGTVQVTRTLATADFASQYTITTKTLTNLTVEYIGTGTQVVTGGLTYGSGTGGGLKISNTSAAVTAAANFVVNGTLTMNGAATVLTPAAAVVVSGTGTLTGTVGNGGTVQVTRTAATADFSSQYTMTTKTLTDLTVEYAGSAAQIVSALTYGGLNINNANGVTLAGTATAGALLRLSNGIVSTGVNVLVASASCPGGVTRTSGHVAGNLRLGVPGGGASPTCVWYIGDASTYRPVTVAFTTVGTAGTVEAVVSQAAGEHPNIGTSAFDSNLDVNRYWTLTNVTTAFTSAIATFTWVAGDVDGGADQLAFVVGRYSAGWTYPTTLPSTLSAQATGLDGTTLTGVFAAGEVSIYSHWRMDQNSWNGTANEVVDSGAGANHGTASTCTFVGCAGSGSAPPKPTTSSVSPAVGTGGVSGTCSYGVFNRSNKDYVSLPGAYPDLMNAAGGFTITAWIKTTDNTLTGQRILIDDQNNTSPGGWGFSVGETATVGGLRFYYRQGTVFLLDTPAIPSNQWLFVAVSVKLAAGANASSASSYVYNTSGTLVTSATATFTWTAGADAGPPSIGGETNASGENTNAYGFSGNIDEVRVYRGPLGASQIDRIRQASRTCATFNHVRLEHGGVGLTCTPATMTVRACFDSSCAQLYNGSVAATLSPTGWVGGDGVAFTGSTAKDLRITTAGTVTLGTTGAIAPAPSVATRCFNGGTETCLFDFKTSGFIFDVPDLSACKTSGNVTITAVRADLTSQKCIPAFESGTRAVNFWSTYTNPATGTLQAEVNGTPVATSSPGTGINLAFAAGAVSTFTVRYPDAGQMQLNARYTGSGSEAGLVMDGVDTFVSAPVGLAVIPSGGACAAGDATCAVYKKAGEAFNHTVRAACWTVDGDTDFSDNPVTPNFQMAAIPLSANLVAPSGGNNASLGATTVTIGSGDSGSKTVSQTVSEVGVFTISVTPAAGAYFGLTIPGSTSPNIGRFTPDHFDVSTNTPSFTAACTAGPTAFSYIGQPFTYGTAPALTVTARNLAGGTTQNYKGTSPAAAAFFKITNASLTGKAYTAETGTLDTAAIGSPDPAIVDNSNGTATLTFNSGTGIAFTRSTPVAPFNAEISLAINVIDTDTIAYGSNPARFGLASAGNGIAFAGGKAMRFGRLRLQGATGMSRQHAASPWLEMAVPARTEYWNGTGFALNIDDSCTTLDRANIALGAYAKLLNACETMVNRGAGATITFASGIGALRLSTPGTGNEGSVLVTPQLGATASGNYCASVGGAESAATAAGKSYLQGAWTGAGWDQNPSAREAFGVYGSQPRNFIFFRENY
jgi:MSHA biogenesis protein MshQ